MVNGWRRQEKKNYNNNRGQVKNVGDKSRLYYVAIPQSTRCALRFCFSLFSSSFSIAIQAASSASCSASCSNAPIQAA